MKTDNRARIPYSVIAIIILMLSAVTLSYLITVSQQKSVPTTSSTAQLERTYESESDRIRNLLDTAVIRAVLEVSNRTYYDGSKIQNDLSDLVVRYFRLLLFNDENGISYTYQSQQNPSMKVVVSSLTLVIGDYNFSYEFQILAGTSSQFVTCSIPYCGVYIKTVGSLKIVITDSVTGLKLDGWITLDKYHPYTLPYLRDQSNRTQDDMDKLDIIIRTITIYLLLRDKRTVTIEMVRDAFDVAFSFFEAMYYQNSSDDRIGPWLNTLSSKTDVDPFEFWVLYYAGIPDPGITIRIHLDLTRYGTRMKFDGALDNLADTEREYGLEHTKLNMNNITQISETEFVIDDIVYGSAWEEKSPFTIKINRGYIVKMVILLG